jgi:hypothetical protein
VSDRLFKLLPAHLRARDAAGGDVLRALLGVLSGELDRVQADLDRTYDNWFIETCDEWVVPYIGDLLGVGPQYVFDLRAASLRPLVADTLGFRRRKGTAAMLEGLGQAVTGWRTRAVEYFQLLAATENLNHQRGLPRTPDLRDTDGLELLGGPFERAGRTVEVRRIASRRGRYDIPYVALFCWRLLSLAEDADEYPGDAPGVRQAVAVPDAAAGPPGRFRMSQLGVDLPLWNPTRTLAEGARVAESDVPGPLRQRAIYDELQAARDALSAGTAPIYRYLAFDMPAFRIFPVGEDEVPAKQIQICDLDDWTAALPPAQTVPLPGGGSLTTRVAVDPRSGRFAFVSGAVPAAVRVSYHHGFAAESGGGCYDRLHTFSDATGLTPYIVAATDPTLPADPAFAAAVAKWVADGSPPALFDFADSATYAAADLSLPAGVRAELRARDHQRPVLRLGACWQLALAPEAKLALNGFILDGAASVTTTGAAGDPLDHDVGLAHCTLVPGAAPSLTSAAAAAGRLTVSLDHCIAGGLDLGGGAAGFEGNLVAADCILGAVVARDATLSRVTAFGTVQATTVPLAEDSIFTAAVTVERTQTGCVRTSFVPPGSTVPRQYRCVAAPAPPFTSTRYGVAGYAQLGDAVDDAIRTGAADGSEMGAFAELHQPQRETNLMTGLDEYLRFGLEAGIFFVT